MRERDHCPPATITEPVGPDLWERYSLVRLDADFQDVS